MSNYRSNQYTYQKHIDAIRALAVIVVWLFHLNPNWFPGGYIGVDIFFVVSGYVITLSILNDVNNRKFNFINFYKKRFFRIFPALFFTILVAFIFYLFFGYLFELNYVSKIALTSLLGISNIFFIYLKSDYFLENELNPFLHTWSLGVEEQFYFLYPILILFLLFSSSLITKIKFILTLQVICIIIILLSFLCFFSFGNSFIGNFYSPLARFWEIVLGCLIFLIFKDKKIYINKLLFFIFSLAFTLIIFFEDYIRNIYLTLIFSSIFTTLILISKNNFFADLNNFYITYLGKISYSLYLWHLPVLYFSKIYLQGIFYIFVNIVVVISLSIFSYSFVEKVFRHNRLAQKTFIISISTIIFLIVLYLVVDLRINNNLTTKSFYNLQISKLSKSISNFNLFEYKYNLSKRTNWNININNRNIENCEYSNTTFSSKDKILRNCLINNTKKNIFIINGDSHATHYFPMIENLSFQKSIYLKTYEGCLFVPNIYIIGKEKYKNRILKDFDKCQKYISRQIENIKNLDSKFLNTYLVLSSRYTSYIQYSHLMTKDINMIDKKIIYSLVYENLNNLASELNNINIILMSPLPEFDHFPFSCFLNKELCKNDLDNDLERVRIINEILERVAINNDNVFLFNTYDKICNLDKNICKMYNSDDDILYFKDKDHLTIEGSQYFTKHFEIFFNENFK